MTRQIRTAGTVIALVVVVLLACSPDLVVRGIVGEPLTSPTFEPTTMALVATASPTQTFAPMSTATNVPPTATVPVSATLPASPTATNTPAPVLPLRTDLPPLALKDWPRPANDNGRCMHFLPVYYYTPRDFEIQIPRLKGLQIRWVLALYGDENQLRMAARQFKDAGIVPIWRKNLRAFQRYYAWDRDIKILNEIGLPPYFQLYNEPDTDTEWEDRTMDRDQWVSIFVQTAKDVYNAGGFVGIQVLDENWLRAALQSIKAQKGERLFTRMFYIPHPYGLNHPPNYTEDDAAVLGFRSGVDVFLKEVGFVPPVIAGEGGWKFKASEDSRFPTIDDKLHAQYHVALFDWFRLGKLSDGQTLPDYLFAFCPWILAGQMEGAAWYDSFEGERTLTIAEVKKIPIFTRKFSWDKK